MKNETQRIYSKRSYISGLSIFFNWAKDKFEKYARNSKLVII